MLIYRKPDQPTKIKLPRPKAEPIILGVVHCPEHEERELQWVADRLANKKPGKVALELPSDFREREKDGVTTFFFGKLVQISEIFDAGVVPLDHPLLVERAQIVSKAMDIIEQGYTEEDIKRDVMRIAQTSFYAPPENINDEMVRAKVLAHAYLLIRLGESAESLARTWSGLMSRRERTMLKRINKEKPDMVVVGDAHARSLKVQLEEYSYLKSPYVPEGGEIRRFSI